VRSKNEQFVAAALQWRSDSTAIADCVARMPLTQQKFQKDISRGSGATPAGLVQQPVQIAASAI
jgi:hypothetical protein